MGKDLTGKEIGKGLRQKSNGNYEGRYVDRFGKRKSVFGKTLKEVKKNLNDAIYENNTEINLQDNIKLDEWFIKWMEVYKFDSVRKNTIRQYNYVYHDFISPALGSLFLKDINQMKIKELIKKLAKKGYGFATKNRIRILLLDMYNKAIINHYARENPAKGITIKQDENEIQVLTQEDQADFFDCCKGTFYDNFFTVAVTSGLRIGELASLTENNIDFKNDIIHVTNTLVYQKYDDDEKKTFHLEDPKTYASKRDVPMNKQCRLAMLKQVMQKRVVADKTPKTVSDEFKDLLFTTKFNTPLNSQIVSDAIDRVIVEINLTRDTLDEMEHFSCHCFRHTFATRCFEAGIQPKTVQAYLGHATLQMTMDLYTTVLQQQKELEMGKLENVLDKLEVYNEEEARYAKAISESRKIIRVG